MNKNIQTILDMLESNTFQKEYYWIFSNLMVKILH